MRQRLVAIGVLSLVSACCSCARETSSEAHDVPERGRWGPLATASDVLGTRSGPAFAWTGKELLVWGGSGYCGPDKAFARCGDGARFNPTDNQWRAMSTTDAPSARTRAMFAWTGQQLIVWGGAGCGDPDESCADGGLYDPATDKWTKIGVSEVSPARDTALSAWTGKELVVWGGFQLRGSLTKDTIVLDTGAALDPATGAWRPITRSGAPSLRMHPAGVWTGREWIVFGGQSSSGASAAVSDRAYAYDPTTDAWRRLSDEGAPSPRWGSAIAWTGNEVVVFGGNLPGGSGAEQASDGAAYDPATNRWRPLPAAPRDQLGAGSAHWTGSLLLVFAGTGAVLDPAADTWWRVAAAGSPRTRAGAAMAWTGSELLVWGGEDPHLGFPVESGGRYVP